MAEEEMITIAEAEKRYSISRDGIYYHVRKGNLTTYKKMGDRKAYLKVSDLEKLAAFRPSSGKEAAKNDIDKQDIQKEDVENFQEGLDSEKEPAQFIIKAA